MGFRADELKYTYSLELRHLGQFTVEQSTSPRLCKLCMAMILVDERKKFVLGSLHDLLILRAVLVERVSKQITLKVRR